VEAAGPTSAWKDIEGICAITQDPKTARAYFERVYLNRPVMASAQAFNVAAWFGASDPLPQRIIQPNALITLGFDGSRTEDSTALIATHVPSGYQWMLGLWEHPLGHGDGWEVPEVEVDGIIEEAFATYNVWRMYGDPSKWETAMSTWAGRYGKDRVVAWSTTLYRKMAAAFKGYSAAINAGEVRNDGDPRMARHLGNACRKDLNMVDDDGSPMWIIYKDRPGSPNKIDAAMAGCLSWQARLDAVASGATESARWVVV
jgi:phage terminase large subunit-like protein